MQRRWNRRLVAVSLIVLLLITSQLAFFRPVRDRLRTFLGAPAAVVVDLGSRFKNAFGVLFAVQDLNRENIELKNQLLQKEAEVAELRFARGENETLKKDLGFQQTRPDLTLVPAAVVNYSPTSLYQAITINKGERDGLKAGQAVVAQGFLVGKIHQVSESTAEVWLLSNRNLVTPVMLTDSQTVGLLKGSIRGLVVENIPLDTKVEKGTPVVTSSLEGLYPAGIALGQVEEILSAKEEIFLTLRISTPVNSGNLTSVVVIKQ